MSSEFSLTTEDNLKILVGQKGADGEISGGKYFGGGGGGASFIHLNGNVVLVSGGGGGAGIGETGLNGFDGSIALTSESGNNANGTVARTNGLPGTNGSAGTAGQYFGGAGGASVSHSGQVANNSSASGGTSWMLGGTGGLFGSYSTGNSANGGFGGGGASLFGGGGGGGYSGGAAGTHGAAFNATGGGGGGSYNTGTNQNNQAGANAGHGKVVITLISGVSESTNNHSNFDRIKIKNPDVPYLSGLSGNDLEIEWHYASPSGGSSSPQWSYKIDNASYSSPAIKYLGSWICMAWRIVRRMAHSVCFIARSRKRKSELARASHAFNYQSSGSGIQSPDSISIIYPDVSYLFASDSNGLEVNFNYQSISGGEQSLSWSYSLDGGAYSSPVSGTRHVTGPTWLSGLSYDWHELRVALLDPSNGNQLAYASHSFKYQSGSGSYQSTTSGTDDGNQERNPRYFQFTSNDLNSLASGANLSEGNHTILKEHNATDSDTFELAPVFIDSNGYVLVEINSSVESSISFTELETYLETNQIQEQGFVDFMPFDFRPFDRIDLNSSSELLATADGYEKYSSRSITIPKTIRLFGRSPSSMAIMKQMHRALWSIWLASFTTVPLRITGTTLSASRSMNQILSLSKDIRTGMRQSLRPILMG